ncbi:iron ABC transporter permease [Actinopolymorpha sp. B11F2]|uniref:ABC transporter permease n=1 Tax=Actinopolymorpha sp. B11F2 TaxID=3160862 RepID=UPI0032E4B4A5
MPALIAAAVALLPLLYLAVRASEQGLGTVVDVLARERTLLLVVRSLVLAATVSGLALVLGVSLAWLVARTRLPGRRFWGVVLALPLAVPSYVAAFAWLSLLPRFGGLAGATLVLGLACYPYVYLPVLSAFERMDPAHEEVSRSLGLGPVRTFVAVTLREVRPAAAAGVLLVMLYVLSDFGAVAILRYDVFARVIYTSYRSSFDPTPAAILGCLLVVLTVVIVWGENRARGRAGYARVGGGVARYRERVTFGWRRALPAVLWCGAVAGVGVGVPFAALAYWLVGGRSAGLGLDELVPAMLTTLGVSALGALVTVALAVPVGVVAARYRGRVGRLLEQAAFVPHALPGIVLALSLVFLSVRYLYPLYQRLPVLVLAYAVLFLPLAVGAVRASVAQSPPVLEEVARSLGRRPLDVLRHITLPLAAPGVAAGAALVFLTCMKELPATLLLRPTGLETLATELWGRTETGAYAAAAPYAAALVLLAALPTFVLGRRWGALREEAGP